MSMRVSTKILAASLVLTVCSVGFPRAEAAASDPPSAQRSPIGACCLDDGSCEWLPKEDCDDLGGSYLGDFTECDPNPCGDPPGACCLSNSACIFVPEGECTDRGGAYLGVGTICDPDPCPTPTTDLTWGKIKNLYRTELSGS